MITDKNMQKLLKIVFGMNHRIILFESTEKKIVDDHRQKYVEITKDCLWSELQNDCVEATEKKISLSAD